MAGNVQEFSDTNFDAEVLGSDQPVLVAFTAVWCGPSKKLFPLVEAVADEYAGRVKVGKLDIDHNPNTAIKYHVRSVPTLVVFKDGKPVNKVVGLTNKRKIAAMFDSAL